MAIDKYPAGQAPGKLRTIIKPDSPVIVSQIPRGAGNRSGYQEVCVLDAGADLSDVLAACKPLQNLIQVECDGDKVNWRVASSSAASPSPAPEEGRCPNCAMLQAFITDVWAQHLALADKLNDTATGNMNLVGRVMDVTTSVLHRGDDLITSAIRDAPEDDRQEIVAALGRMIENISGQVIGAKVGKTDDDTSKSSRTPHLQARERVINALGDSRAREIAAKDELVTQLYLAATDDEARGALALIKEHKGRIASLLLPKELAVVSKLLS